MPMRVLPCQCIYLVVSVIVLGSSALAWGQQWQDVAGDLMSPACPGRTLLNCTSSQAEQWRELIRQKLTKGESKEQILQYFVDISGEAILAAPPKKGFALTAWLLPLFVVMNGAVLIIALTRRWAQRRAADAPDIVSHDATVPPSLPSSDPYLHRLHRELEKFND
jgi:cytochrome c-type biogenesis protein CcmH